MVLQTSRGMPDPERSKKLLAAEEDAEELKQRLEREHGELLDELRALIPGAEVLFGFLLAIRFADAFGDLTSGQRHVYYGTLLSTATALVFFLAPSAYHRVRFRRGDKEQLVRKGNREAILGTVASAFAFTGAIYLVTDLLVGTIWAVGVAATFFGLIVWRWWAVALHRNWVENRDSHSRDNAQR